MPDVWWIKIATEMFDDEKIKLVEAMPDGDSLLVIWVKLLCQAGKVNSNGYIFLTKDIPFTDDDLVTLFRKPINTIRLALMTFQRFGMIQIDDKGIILLPNWGKYQSLKGLDDIREQTRLRVEKYRQLHSGNVTRDVTVTNNVTECNAQSKSKNIELDKEYINTANDDKNFGEICQIYESNIGQLTGLMSDDLKLIADEYSSEWFKEACLIACQRNVRKLSYIRPILEDWKVNGFKNKKVGKNANHKGDTTTNPFSTEELKKSVGRFDD